MRATITALVLAALIWPGAAAAQTGPISGYMEMHYNKPVADEFAAPILDFHRFVLLLSHRFSDRIHFFGEIEIEHAIVSGLEDKGEIEVEQAFIDFLARPELNFRAGMLIAPFGIINERHEPPTFYGVERPFVDTLIIPTTWFDVGAGVHGTLGSKFRYRAYVMAPLDSAFFTGEEGFRGAAQNGVKAQVRSMALTGRLEYIGTPGLVAGGSFWTGDSRVTFERLETPTTMVSADARYVRDRFQGRAIYAQGFVDGAAELNDAIFRQTGIDPNVARQIRGFYFEGSYLVLPRSFEHDLGLFLRYENFDTQFQMDEGNVKIPEFDRDAWVVGANYWLDPDVVLKVDYSHVRTQSEVVPGPRSFNLGIGWWF